MLLIVSDCTRCQLLSLLDHEFNYSDNDPTGICNVELIQTNPLGPPVNLCATGYCRLRFVGPL